jgi:DNA repair protein RadC
MDERPHYHGHRDRLREKLRRDSTTLADYELLELVLGHVHRRKDTKPLAKLLLQRYKNLRGVFSAQPEELRTIKDFGPSLESFWQLLAELKARIDEAPVTSKVVFSSPRVVADVAMARLGDRTSEEFWVALVDNKNRLMAWERLSKGTVDQAPVYPREVLGLALERKASGIVMVHNHPGGDPRPSAADIELTRRIGRAAEELGVRMLDHLIVAESEYFSFQSQGML